MTLLDPNDVWKLVEQKYDILLWECILARNPNIANAPFSAQAGK